MLDFETPAKRIRESETESDTRRGHQQHSDRVKEKERGSGGEDAERVRERECVGG